MQNKIPRSATALLHRLHACGYEAYLVGGCVRDLLREHTPSDYDMTTSATPEQMLSVFFDHRVILTGMRHGTVTVLSDGVPYEITTYRVDGTYADGRHPDSVTFTRSLTEDLARRDFTVNAMAYSPALGLCDPFGGQSDLAAGCIRAVGDPYLRFREDALRILRALRFSSTLGFQIERETESAALALCGSICQISPERVRGELTKLLWGVDAARVLSDYRAILLSSAMSLAPLADRLDGAIPLVAALPRDPVLRLIGLLSPLSEQQAEQVLLSLRFDKKTVRRAAAAVGAASLAVPVSDSEILGFLARHGTECLSDRLALARAAGEDVSLSESRLSHLLSEGAPYTVGMLAVTGGDLLSLGFARGKAIGRMLEQMLLQTMRGDLHNTKEELLAYAERNKGDAAAHSG